MANDLTSIRLDCSALATRLLSETLYSPMNWKQFRKLRRSHISPKQNGDIGISSEEQIATLPTPYGMDGSPENQHLVDVNTYNSLPQQDMPQIHSSPDYTPFIPADFDGPIPGYMPIEQVRTQGSSLHFDWARSTCCDSSGYWWLFLFYPLHARKNA